MAESARAMSGAQIAEETAGDSWDRDNLALESSVADNSAGDSGAVESVAGENSAVENSEEDSSEDTAAEKNPVADNKQVAGYPRSEDELHNGDRRQRLPSARPSDGPGSCRRPFPSPCFAFPNDKSSRVTFEKLSPTLPAIVLNADRNKMITELGRAGTR